MTLLLAALALLLGGGIIVLATSRPHRDWSWLAAGVVVVAAIVGGIPAVQVLAGGTVSTLHWPWAVPFGQFALGLDPLSAWFLLPTLLLSALAAIYGAGYGKSGAEPRSLGPVWFFYCLLVLSMVLVVLARNAILFLFAWELMAVASYFLVTVEHERPEVRQAGWIYLAATQVGTAFLLALFLLLARQTGSMDFTVWAARGIPAGGWAAVLFVLAAIGLGTKAGFMPLHGWLPEAHPAAPSHVSALMSGVMIKTGIYGFLRVLTFLRTPPLWWGWTFIGIGMTSGVLGVLWALAQHDLKRLLAYHSIENIGIIALGMGVGMIGWSTGSAPLMVLGFGGALLHVLNHSLFKGLLFLAAGAVLQQTGEHDLDRLGGLLRRMPWTGTAFLIGAAAICGLPPLNGFISEFLIFLGALRGVALAPGAVAVSLLAVVAGLGLIGGLAVACFTKAFGVVFLGTPRSESARTAAEVGPAMIGPMLILAAACILVGLLAPLAVATLPRVLTNLTGLPTAAIHGGLAGAVGPLLAVVTASVVLLVILGLLMLWRRRLLSRQVVATGTTWGCGYAQPTPRMQYTASSFAQPLLSWTSAVLGGRRQLTAPNGYFPAAASLHTQTPDPLHPDLYRPALDRIGAGLARQRWLQPAAVQLCILYIALALLALLIWKFG